MLCTGKILCCLIVIVINSSWALKLDDGTELLHINLPQVENPPGIKYPMKFQPEYEDFAMAKYFRTRDLVRFQIRCFFYGGPCDIVGRWAKPRIKTGFLGPCIKCTAKQSNWLSDSLNLVAETDPDLFRAVIARYIEFYGVKLPAEERLRVALAFEV